MILFLSAKISIFKLFFIFIFSIYVCFIKKSQYLFFYRSNIFYFLLIKKQKARQKYDNGGKGKAGEFDQTNKDAIKEKAKNKYKNLTEEEKKAKKAIFQK